MWKKKLSDQQQYRFTFYGLPFLFFLDFQVSCFDRMFSVLNRECFFQKKEKETRRCFSIVETLKHKLLIFSCERAVEPNQTVFHRAPVVTSTRYIQLTFNHFFIEVKVKRKISKTQFDYRWKFANKKDRVKLFFERVIFTVEVAGSRSQIQTKRKQFRDMLDVSEFFWKFLQELLITKNGLCEGRTASLVTFRVTIATQSISKTNKQ